MPEETSAASGSASAEEKPCSSAAAAAADGSTDIMEEAKKLIGTGKRHLVMGDVVSAVGVFQDACGMLAAKYGDTADECGEAAFLCGKSLLELARMENGVLGNALEGVPEEAEEEEQPGNPNIENADNLDDKTREELRRQVYDAMAEEEKTEAADEKLEPKDVMSGTELKEKIDIKAPVTHVVNGAEEPPNVSVNGEDGSVQDAKMETKSPAVPVQDEGKPCPRKETVEEESDEQNEEKEDKSNSEDDQEESGGSRAFAFKTLVWMHCGEVSFHVTEDDDDDDDEDDGDGNDQDKEEEDVGNLQLAWEMLEVAKVIYKRKEGKEDQLMAAQAYLKLGEVSAESGNYPQALEDFQECLALQLKHLPPHSRLLAETHYHVATTLCYMDEYSQAIQHYNSSIKVIEARLAMLQEVIEAAEGADAAKEERSEVDELKLLLPDIKEKVEDAKESQRTASAASQAIQQTLGGASTSSTFLHENGGPSTAAFASTSQSPAKACEGSSSTKAVSDISHLVRKKRKPEEESPVKDTDAKQAKQETTVNGSGDSSASNGNGVQEGKSQESATESASVKSSA